MSNARNIANLPNGDDAPVYACRAWVNFDGTTNTAGYCTIRDSGNVSTVADNGTGDYRINLTTAMPDTNYAIVSGSKQDDTFNDRNLLCKAISTSEILVQHEENGVGKYDVEYAHVAIFR